MLGGGSAINAGIARRARPDDFARWAAHGLPRLDVGNGRWTRTRRWRPATSWIRAGTGHTPDPGPIRQAQPDDLAPVVRAFVEAAASTGLPWINDFNGQEQHGVGCEVKNVVDGVRSNVGMRYLTAEVRAPRKPDDPPRDVGRQGRVRGRPRPCRKPSPAASGSRRARGDRPPAGVYGSPAILLRSGIGPKAHLDGLGIPVRRRPAGRRAPPGPQPMFTVAYTVRGEVPEGRMGASGIVWTRSSRARGDELDLQLSVSAQPDLDDKRCADPHASHLGLRGHAARHGHGALEERRSARNAADRLSPTGGRGRPVVRLREAVELTQRIMRLSPVARAGRGRAEPRPGRGHVRGHGRGDPCRRDGLSTMACATAPMGGDDDPGAVVDAAGLVRGVESLRVVDASIIPEAISVPRAPHRL